MEELEPHVSPSYNKCPCIQLRRDYQRSVGQILNHWAGEREGRY